MFVDSFCGFDVFGWYGAKGINACIHIDDKYVYVYIYRVIYYVFMGLN